MTSSRDLLLAAGGLTASPGLPRRAMAADPRRSRAAEQRTFLGNHGCRVTAHGRRSHGRSDPTWSGNDMDKLLPNANLKAYAGAPHGMCVTHADKVNADLLAFLQG